MKLNYTLTTTHLSLFALVMLASGASNAQSSCIDNTSPGSTSCTNLQINAPTGSIEIAGTVSTVGGGVVAPSIDITSTGNVTTMSITSTGRVENPNSDGIYNRGGRMTQLQNAGTIISTHLGGAAVHNLIGGAITSLDNAGLISGSRGIFNSGPSSTIGSITNSGSVTGVYGVVNQGGTINNITNTGVINANETNSNSHAIYNIGGNIGTIINSGSINSIGIDSLGSNASYAIFNTGAINTITNTATVGTPTSGIYGASGVDINNTGTITTLNNAQNNLVLQGNLPTNYNIIISGPTSFGGLSYYPLTGAAATQTNFGIYSGSTVTRGTYSQVLIGLATTNIGARSGSYQGLTWALTSANNSDWDLSFTGTNTAVMTAKNLTAQGLQTAFALQNTVLVNGFAYDCPIFDKNNVCVSAGGRYTAVDAQSVNSGAGVLIGAYRFSNQVRFGAYIDQNVSTNTSGIIKVSNGSPMVGLFGVWSERLDGTGTEVRVSAGYGQKGTTMTRPVIDGTEPGSGSSTLTSQGAQVIAKYGFGVLDNTVVSPYAGLRYTQNNMNGYTEGTSATVTAPLTYAPLNTNATTIVAGLGATFKVIPAVTLLASAGVESDTNTNYSAYSATGLFGLTSINMNPNPKNTRPTAMLGAYYDLEKNQRISLTGIYRQAPYQGVGATTYMALYTIGL